MSNKKVSPRGIGSGIRMNQFFINRAGKHLSRKRRDELERAKEIVRSKIKSHRRGSERAARS
jgi:hypothetical protein